MVAVSIGFGMIPLVAPNFFKQLPHELHPLLESGILLAAIAAVLLNAFFNGDRLQRRGARRGRRDHARRRGVRLERAGQGVGPPCVTRVRFLLGHELSELDRVDPTMTVLDWLRLAERRDRHQGGLQRGRLRRLHRGGGPARATAGWSTARSMPASSSWPRSTAASC